MMDVQYIGSPKEIPAGISYVLVLLGSESGHLRHGAGLTMVVKRDRSDFITEIAFQTAIESARSLAEREGLDAVFACK
jgi:hypothetical protein